MHLNDLFIYFQKLQTTILGPPSPPQGPLSAKPAAELSVELAWNKSANDNGSDITGYCVEKKEGKRQWSHVETTKDVKMTIGGKL